MQKTLSNGKWRKRLKIKALPPFAELHKVRAENCKIFMTKQIFPEDENYFVRQIGKNWANIRLEKDCAFRIYKIKEEGLK